MVSFILEKLISVRKIGCERGQPLAFIPQDLIDSGLRPVVGIVMWSRQCSETDYRHGIEFLGDQKRIFAQTLPACEAAVLWNLTGIETASIIPRAGEWRNGVRKIFLGS